MPASASLRTQIESALAHRIPSALTPAPRIVRPVISSGIHALDSLLNGGLPLGAITEVVGPECSGRSTFALSFLAQITNEAKVCAWIDASDSLHPESAAAAGIDITRLLWVRCGVTSTKEQSIHQSSFALPEKYLVPPLTKKGSHGGGFGPHPRGEVKGLSDAIRGLLRPDVAGGSRCAEPQRHQHRPRETFKPASFQNSQRQAKAFVPKSPLSRIDQALRVTDLLLQAGGFSAIVLDLGSIAPEYASRVPLAMWFRYRAAAERTLASILLLTQHPCTKSSAELVLRMQPGDPNIDEQTIFTGISHRVEIVRERFPPAPTNVIPLRKPPQNERHAGWHSRTVWAGR